MMTRYVFLVTVKKINSFSGLEATHFRCFPLEEHKEALKYLKDNIEDYSHANIIIAVED